MNEINCMAIKLSVRSSTFHGGDELFLSVIVGGQDLVKPLQLVISAVVLLVQRYNQQLDTLFTAHRENDK